MSTVLTPTPTNTVIARTADQRLQALQRANQVRVRRAQMKQHFRDGTERPILLLANPPGWIATMRVTTYLTAIPKIGMVKARDIMHTVRIADSKTVGGLSERQRSELAQLLQGRRCN